MVPQRLRHRRPLRILEEVLYGVQPGNNDAQIDGGLPEPPAEGAASHLLGHGAVQHPEDAPVRVPAVAQRGREEVDGGRRRAVQLEVAPQPAGDVRVRSVAIARLEGRVVPQEHARGAVHRPRVVCDRAPVRQDEIHARAVVFVRGAAEDAPQFPVHVLFRRRVVLEGRAGGDRDVWGAPREARFDEGREALNGALHRIRPAVPGRRFPVALRTRYERDDRGRGGGRGGSTGVFPVEIVVALRVAFAHKERQERVQVSEAVVLFVELVRRQDVLGLVL
mmetsp:Transcript_26658/g.53138  ORF Transcript_26658/g.53138 Transcript_26658/m.53138 type:complete len:278 (+) Transcript_26658:202-1035(+)